jgi:hypothetical protein
MTTPTTRIVLGLSAFVVAVSLSLTPLSARAQSSGQALEIGPPILNLSANPGQTIKANISLRDISGGGLRVTNQINDFVAGGEDGTPKILLEEGATSPYSIREWITPLPQILLKAREIKIIPVTITVPTNASPGGYYGVVRFTGTPPEVEGSGVSLSASLGALILLKVNGVAKESLTIEQFFASDGGNPGSLFEAAPIKFVARLANSGNIHEEPYGLVTVKDMFNNVVATLPINQPARDILPGSIRRFENAVLDSSNIGNRVLFGLYQAKLDVTYGVDKKTVTEEIRFWVIPYKAILAIVIGLVLIFFGLRFFIRRYNRLIIERAKNSKK